MGDWEHLAGNRRTGNAVSASAMGNRRTGVGAGSAAADWGGLGAPAAADWEQLAG